MHTTPNPIVPNPDLHTELRDAEAAFKLVTLRVQTKALETLEALMEEPVPTGDTKKDAFIARERNRRRMAATQALTHIRSVQRDRQSTAKVRTKAEKHNPEPVDAPNVPLAACRPVQGLENRSIAEMPPKRNKPAPPKSPSPPLQKTLTNHTLTPDLQRDWLRERKQAMAKARSKRKPEKRGKR